MNFAKKQLEKYGWSEGKGLGKEENGLQEALKPKLKRSAGGIGHNVGDEFTNNWWERIYDKAADNIEVKTKNNGEIRKLLSKEEDSFNIDTRKFIKSKKSLSNKSYLQTFVKRATLKGNEIQEEVKQKDETSDSEDGEKEMQPAPSTLTDEQLFAACGGRTAHKGARHGLKSNGKLARIMEQEKDLYDSMKKKRDNVKELSPTPDKHHKTKSFDVTGKLIGNKDIEEIKSKLTSIEEVEAPSDCQNSKKIKSKKKTKKQP